MLESINKVWGITRDLLEGDERKPLQFKGKLTLDSTLKGIISEDQLSTEEIERKINDLEKKLEEAELSDPSTLEEIDAEEALHLSQYKLREEYFRRKINSWLGEVSDAVNTALKAGSNGNLNEEIEYLREADQMITAIKSELDDFKPLLRSYSSKIVPVKWSDLEEYRRIDKKLGMVGDFIFEVKEGLYEKHPELKKINIKAN